MEKKELRKTIRLTKRQYGREQLAALSLDICGRLYDKVGGAKVVMAYHPLSDEVDITPVIEKMRREGITVVMPQVTGDDTMVVRKYDGEKDLKQGAFGIMEPCGQLFTEYDTIDIAIIPGMAFDRQGNRLGRGKGYYDRFLNGLHAHIYKIGVCFGFQLLESIPAEKHDIRMDEVVAN